MGEQQQSRTIYNINDKSISKAASKRGSSNNIIGGLKDDETKIELILRRHPHEIKVNSLRKEYIRTTNEITVATLKIYLGKKLSYNHHEHFEVREILCWRHNCNLIYIQFCPLIIFSPLLLYIDVDIDNHEQ